MGNAPIDLILPSGSSRVLQHFFRLSFISENERVLIDFKKENIEGGPDGMTIDNNGDLWIACYKGFQVRVCYRTLLRGRLRRTEMTRLRWTNISPIR